MDAVRQFSPGEEVQIWHGELSGLTGVVEDFTCHGNAVVNIGGLKAVVGTESLESIASRFEEWQLN
jgi:hypothetical protein